MCLYFNPTTMSLNLCLPVSTTGHLCRLQTPPARLIPPSPACSPLTLVLCCCPIVTGPLFLTHPRLRPALPLFPNLRLNFHGSLSHGGFGARSGYSLEQPGLATHCKLGVMLHTNNSDRALCCAFIGDEGGRVCFQTAGACDVQFHSNDRRRAKLKAGIYFQTPSENIAHCFLVGNVEYFYLHHDTDATFMGSSVSNWTVALNIWNTTRDLEDSGRR